MPLPWPFPRAAQVPLQGAGPAQPCAVFESHSSTLHVPHRNVQLHRMCHCLCTAVPQNASTRSADIPAATAVCITGTGRGCHEHQQQSCPPTPVQPTQGHHMPGRKALCGLTPFSGRAAPSWRPHCDRGYRWMQMPLS